MNIVRKLIDFFLSLPMPVRYLFVGGWNTVFGFSIYALLYFLWGDCLHYLLLLIPANILAITNAFLCYKYLVFRSSANPWIEYFKCCLVYGGMALVNAGLLYLGVTLARLNPVVANGLTIVICTVVSYLSHKYFSFSQRNRS